VAAHHIRRVAPGARLHLLSDPRLDITIGLNGWLIPLGRSSPAALRSRVVALMDELEPCPPVRARIAAFRARHFHPSTVGVHLRRGDFLRHRPDVVGNTPQAMEAVDRFLAVAPRARIFLCTDDGARDQKQARLEGVHAIFRARYGEQVVSTTPRSLERHTVEGVQDALVDLWLLRETSMMVGTRGSSFSDLAVFGRDVPYAMVGGASGRYERFYRLARVTGVDRVVRGLFRALYGYDRPFPQAWNQLVLGPLRRARERVAWRGIR
jgi:hypothetical protein